MSTGSSRASAALTAFVVLVGARAVAAEPRACVPGAQVECSCVGGTKSVQVCAPDGASLLPCQCLGAGLGSSTPAAGGAMGLDVSTSAPATVSVDGADVGRSPVHVADLPSGVHLVRAQFDGGGEMSRKVRVQPGQPAILVLEPPASRQAATFRAGRHPVVSAGAEAVGLENHFGGGISPELAMNVGLSAILDLRFGARLTLAQTDRGFVADTGVPASVRLNLGGTFALGLGAFVGLRSAPGHYEVATTCPLPCVTSYERPRELGLLAGPEAFPAIFRFGKRRELELALEFGWLFSLATSGQRAYDVVHFGVNMTYLLLPS